MESFEASLGLTLAKPFQFRIARNAAAFALAVFVALLAASPSFAWHSTYVVNTWLPSGDWRATGFVSNINYNSTSWNNGAGGVLAMKLTLCHPSDSCYVVSESFSGYLQDFRSISYGAAWCGAESGNPNQTYVYNCYALNPAG
jgi:hypothetical protein